MLYKLNHAAQFGFSLSFGRGSDKVPKGFRPSAPGMRPQRPWRGLHCIAAVHHCHPKQSAILMIAVTCMIWNIKGPCGILWKWDYTPMFLIRGWLGNLWREHSCSFHGNPTKRWSSDHPTQHPVGFHGFNRLNFLGVNGYQCTADCLDFWDNTWRPGLNRWSWLKVMALEIPTIPTIGI